MHFKHRIGATLVGLGLFTAPVVVPAFAQQLITPTPASGQVTPAAASQDASTTSEEEEAQQELSASDAEIEEFVNEDTIEEAPPTEEELTGESQDTGGLAAPAASKINYRERALATAKRQIGYKEGFKNQNKFSQYFGKDHQPWCADFVSWAFDSTGNKNKKLLWKNPSAVASILAWAKKDAKHRLVTTPKPGDVFIIRKIVKGEVIASHTGLVWQVAKDGKTFRTIEGNSGRRTDRVSSNWKPVSSKYKFVRIPNNLFPL